MVHCADDQFFLHSYGEDGITILEFFVPSVIRVCIRKFENVLDALTTPKDDITHLPVDTRIMVLEPVMSKVYIFLAEVSDSEVDVLAVFSNGHMEFSNFHDIATPVSGTISIIDRDRDSHLSGLELMLLNINVIDRASSTPTIYECLCCQCLSPSARTKSDFEHEVVRTILASADVAKQFTEFVESF